jgi:TIR domain
MVPEYTTVDQMKSFVPERQQRQRLLKTAASKQHKNTFLSHSSKDNGLVPAAILILENHGGRVYVDIGDERLPRIPSVQTAQILRNTLRELRRFVLLVSPNSKGSTWVPWELGLADGQKGVPAVALFPVVESTSESKWTEYEYLGLYSRIVWGHLVGHEKPLWMVYNHHENSAVTLYQWLQGS